MFPVICERLLVISNMNPVSCSAPYIMISMDKEYKRCTFNIPSVNSQRVYFAFILPYRDIL